QDGWYDYTEQEVSDPLGPEAAGAERVVRGGSWDNEARYVRCACRIQHSPDIRLHHVGFRPARVQS
ncbi:MAG: SUMF1/EgtB/PvdO family nonheme iron enzyme, partial [Pseudomonadota bacterium]